MDEPFAALDAQTRESLQEELIRIWKHTGTTVVFITHSIDEAVYLGQRVAVMTSQPGRIRAIVDIPELNYSENEDVRSHPTFVRYRHEIWQLLREEKDHTVVIDASSQIQKIQIQSKTCVWTTRWSKCHQVQVRRGDARSEHFVRRLGTGCQI